LKEVGPTTKRFFKIFSREENSNESLQCAEIMQHFITQNKLLLHGAYTCIYRRRVEEKLVVEGSLKPTMRCKLHLTLASRAHFLTFHTSSHYPQWLAPPLVEET